MVAVPKPVGVNFKDPWLMYPMMTTALTTRAFGADGVDRTTATTQFFTEMASRGLQDQTNWTSNTYKTLLSVTSGKGEVYCMNGPTAGGAETTTFEITVDGVLDEIAVGTLASGERAFLHCGLTVDDLFTTATQNLLPGTEILEADKATWGASGGGDLYVPPWWAVGALRHPMLQFDNSLLIRAKHSASITNSTATAYSAVMYRLGL